MNIIALITALIGLVMILIVIILSNKIKYKWLKAFAMTIGIVFAIGLAGSLPSLQGDNQTSTSAKAGEYMVYLGIAIWIIKSIFLKKKPPSE